jgi:hypothetical protein
MANEQLRQQMQEALDGDPDAHQHVLETLRARPDERESRHWDNLLQVDDLLQTAPFERAPAKMALHIMAKIVEQAKAQPREDISALAVTLSIALVTVVMMPMLMAASWLVLNSLASAELLSRAIEQTVFLLVILIETLQKLIEEAQNLAEDNPEAAAMVAALIPLTLLGFVEYLEELLDLEI